MWPWHGAQAIPVPRLSPTQSAKIAATTTNENNNNNCQCGQLSASNSDVGEQPPKYLGLSLQLALEPENVSSLGANWSCRRIKLCLEVYELPAACCQMPPATCSHHGPSSESWHGVNYRTRKCSIKIKSGSKSSKWIMCEYVACK